MFPLVWKRTQHIWFWHKLFYSALNNCLHQQQHHHSHHHHHHHHHHRHHQQQQQQQAHVDLTRMDVDEHLEEEEKDKRKWGREGQRDRDKNRAVINIWYHSRWEISRWEQSTVSPKAEQQMATQHTLWSNEEEYSHLCSSQRSGCTPDISTPPCNCTGKGAKNKQNPNYTHSIIFSHVTALKQQNVLTLWILLLKVESVGPGQQLFQLPVLRCLIVSLLLSDTHPFLGWVLLHRRHASVLWVSLQTSPVIPECKGWRAFGHVTEEYFPHFLIEKGRKGLQCPCDGWQTCSVLTIKPLFFLTVCSVHTIHSKTWHHTRHDSYNQLLSGCFSGVFLKTCGHTTLNGIV